MKYLAYIMPLFLLAAVSCNSKTHHTEAEHVEDTEEHDHDHDRHVDEIVFQQEKAERFGVKTSVVKLSDFSETIIVSGQIYPAQNNEHVISATKSGILQFKQGINLGSPVKKGETIATISANQIIGGDEGQSKKITLENTKREYDRIYALYKDHLATERDFLAAKEAYEQAQNSYKPQTETTASTTTGIITKLYANNGKYVNTGEPIATVSANDSFILCAYLPERYGNMKIKSANFKSAYSDSIFSISDFDGKLMAQPCHTVSTAGYLPIYFSFSKDDGIATNSYAEVYLLGNTRHNVISIPLTALTEEQGNFFVYEKVDAEGYVKHLVSLGMNDGFNVEILSGLTPGMEIVTNGATIVKLAANSGAVPGHSHEH